MNFLKILFCAFSLQLVSVAAFVIPNELSDRNSDMAFFLNISVLAIFLVVYYMFRKKAAQKLDMSGIRFNLYLFVSWIFASIATFYIVLKMVDIGVLHGSGGWFSGLEYLVMGAISIIYAIGIFALNLAIWLFNKIKRLIDPLGGGD